MVAVWRLAARSASGFPCVRSTPSTRICPPETRSRPRMQRNMLDLPAPEGPRRATFSPSATFSEIPSRTRCPPRSRVTERSSTAGAVIPRLLQRSARPVEEAVDAPQTLFEVIGNHADADPDVSLDTEPRARADEDTLLGPQAHAQLLGRHRKVICQKRHPPG